VLVAAADGSGPPIGARVVGHAWDGGWAERVAVATDALVELPDAIRRFSYWPHDEPDRIDLRVLVELVSAGRLHPEIGLLADWQETPAALVALRDRRIRGNAVLTIPAAS
jgi:NADPH:quinone reductase-like Zn-dependent oxidoreductase